MKTVYPMGLPGYEPVRMELENREILNECTNGQLTKVADRAETKLWFASKELVVGMQLKDFMGKNEKTKAVIKMASRQSGQPAREPVFTEEQQKIMMMQSAKRREELQQLEQNSDDSYMNSEWADQGSLKRKVLALDNISWKPKF